MEATIHSNRQSLSRSSSMLSHSARSDAGNAWLWHNGGVRTAWDGLRRDFELWDFDGDCVVYLFSRGASRRPASIRTHRRFLEEARCTQLLSLLDEPASPSSASTTEASSGDEQSSPTSPSFGQASQLFLAPPKHLGRDETYRWHLSTRNFFAWLLRKPLAGQHLGLALSDLLDPMELHRSSEVDNVFDILAYADDMGYTCLAQQPDYATAMLVFAHEKKLRNVWIDAFSHCVGMSDRIGATPDHEALGAVNRALVAKSSIQMDIDLEAKSHAIGTMLEDDLKRHLGLTPSARQHLDDFRSFLHAHFVASFGYWPPQQDRYSKKLYSAVAEDFESLFDLVADHQSRTTQSSRQNGLGGICVLQNIASFDERHGFSPLSAALPLLPDPVSSSHKLSHRHSIRGFIGVGGLRETKSAALAKARAAHVQASNSHDDSWQRQPLLKTFLDFETMSANASDDQLSSCEGRKVRWLLIYGMLQMLRSILRAAPEVTDKDEAPYPLCCDTRNLPTWDRPTAPDLPNNSAVPYVRPQQSAGQLSVHPDGETDYASYFSTSKPLYDEMKLHPALRQIKPLRTRSTNLSMSRPRVLSRVFSSSSHMISSPLARQVTSETESPIALESEIGRGSPVSEAPSLDWSRDSTSSQDNSSQGRSSGEMVRRSSTSSSVYSVRREEEVPEKKRPDVGDVIDKGLAFEDFICPGLC